MSIGRRAAGLLAAVAVIVAVSAAWIVHLRLGPRLEGWVAGPMVIFVPMMALVIYGVWMLVRAVAGRWIRWAAGTVALGSAATVLVVLGVYCGPTACFVADSPNRQLGWFVLAAVVGAAIAYQLVRGGGQARQDG